MTAATRNMIQAKVDKLVPGLAKTSRCLDHHHGNAEGADELQAIGVRNLRGVLQSRENSGRDAKESSPEAKLFSSRA